MRSKIMYGKLRLVGNEKAYTWTLHHHEKGRSQKDVKGKMVRAPCIDKNGMKKGAWSEDEDNKLRDYIQRFGHCNWRELPKYAGLARCGKSCRLRWMNYLRPSVKRGNFTKEEEDIIIKLHLDMGNKWSAIAALLPGRSDNEIKNHWHTHLKKRSIKENNNLVHEEHKSRIEHIINFSVLRPSFVSTSSENRIANESTSRSCVQHQLLIDLNQEYAESWEEDSELKELIEC